MRRIFLFCLLGMAVTLLGDANLIKNGDFEAGIAPWKPYRGNWKEPYSPVQVAPCNEPGHGNYAAKVTAQNGITAAGVQYELKLPEKIRKYQIAFQFKISALQNGWVQMTLQRRVELPDGKRKMILLWSSSTTPTHRGGGVMPWSDFREEFVLVDDLPPGRDFLTFRLGGRKVAGEAWFDNITVEPLPGKGKKTAAVQVFPGAKRSGVNLLQDDWSCRSEQDCVPVKLENGVFATEIPSGKRAVWNYTVYSTTDNIQGPMRFSFRSRYPLNSVLRCTLFPSEKKHDVVHTAQPVGPKDADGFQTYAVEFDPLPRTGRMIITLSAGSKQTAKKMCFKEVTLERIVPVNGRVSLYNVRHGKYMGLFPKNDRPYSDFRFENATAAVHKLPVTLEVKDFYGRKVFAAQKLFELPPQSITNFKVEYPDLKQLGFYSVSATWPLNNTTAAYKGGFVLVDEPPENPDKLFAFTPWDGDIAWQYPEVQKLLGCGLKAITFFGRFVQDSNFAVYDRTVEAYEKANMKIVGTLAMPSGRLLPGFKPDPEKIKRGEFPYGDDYFQEAHRRITALARHYRGRIKYWILYDELDCSVLRYNYAVEHYVRLAKVVSAALKAVDSENIVTGLTVTGHDNKAVPRYPLLRKVWPQLKDHFDGLSLDAYSAGNTFGPNWTAKDPVNGEFKAIVQEAYAIAKADGKTRLSIHERGYAHTAGMPIDGPYAVAEAQAYAADYVLAKTMPELEFMLNFTWRWGNDGFNREFGFFQHENASPSAAVFAAAARRLAHIKYLQQIKLQYKALQCYAFKRGNTTVIPLWISSDPTDFNITAEFRCPAVEDLKLFDLQGNEVPLVRDGKNMVLTLSAAPLYLESNGSVETLAQALKQGHCQLPELTADLMLVNARTVRSYVKNLTSGPLTAEFELNAGGKTVRRSAVLEPESITPVEFAVKNISGSGSLDCMLNARTANNKPYITQRSLEHLSLRKVSSMQELEKLPPLVDMNGRSYINDLDSVANKVWYGDEDCSAKVRLGYTDKALLLSVQIADEKHVAPWGGKNIWKGDCIQFAFETARDAVKRKMQNQLGFIKSDRLYTAALVNGREDFHLAPVSAGKSSADCRIERNEVSGTTSYRFIIPWSELSVTAPTPGQVVGFVLMIADSDWENRQFQYRLELGRGIDGAFHDPSQLLSLILE